MSSSRRRLISVKQSVYNTNRLTGAPTNLNPAPGNPNQKYAPSSSHITTMETRSPNRLPVSHAERARLRMIAEYQENKSLQEIPIEEIVITLYSDEELKREGVKIDQPSTSPDITGSVMDPRMGIQDDHERCLTCGKDNMMCPGHFGYIDLVRDVYQYPFITEVVKVLQSVCNFCGSLLLDREKLEESRLLELEGITRLKHIAEHSRNVPCQRGCPSNPDFSSSQSKKTYEIQIEIKDEETDKKKTIVYSIERVKKILECISDEDSELLGFSNGSKPSSFIRSRIPVLPPRARPDPYQGGERKSDSLTLLYVDIIKSNNVLKGLKKSANEFQSHYNDLVNKINSIVEVPSGTNSVYAIDDLKSRLQGKKSLIRGAMMGVRVDFSARSVITPDPSLRFGQVSIPEEWASTLTKRVHVTEENIEYIRELGKQGKISFYVKGRFSAVGGRIYKYKPGDYVQIKPGDDVERHLQNGDYVILNRQPTLHKYGMMGFEVVLKKQKTIGLDPSCTGSYNADFDGDEMNVHVPQTPEADMEVRFKMNVKNCMLSTASSRPTIGLIMDAVVAARLLTIEDVTIDHDLWYSSIDLLTNRSGLENLEERLERFGVPMYSGRALFSTLLPPDFFYMRGGVVILNGILIKGVLKKSYLGAAQGSILHVLLKDYGAHGVQRASDFITDAQFVLNHWLIARGFSIGFKDCMPVNENFRQEMYVEYLKTESRIQSAGARLQDPVMELHRQKLIKGALSDMKNVTVEKALAMLPKDSNLVHDVESGAKGDTGNISQISGALSQIQIQGDRPALHITNKSRSLPYFLPEIDPETGKINIMGLSSRARGNCVNSYLSGLTPAENIFSAAAGREGLIDTAGKTPEIGDLSHRIMKALENLSIYPDGTVRNSVGTIYQFAYGNDGLNPKSLETVDVDGVNRISFVDIKRLANRINMKRGFTPKKFHL